MYMDLHKACLTEFTAYTARRTENAGLVLVFSVPFILFFSSAPTGCAFKEGLRGKVLAYVVLKGPVTS